MSKAMQGQQPLFEWLARHKDGHLFWVEVSMRKADIDGTPHILVTVRDIGERKRMEQALIQEAPELDRGHGPVRRRHLLA
ncbi:MAG: PAS domain S-box protein [Chromatiales bacterium]|nr:PAS domain S-box protein [Chromatiales bacterium]